MRHGHVAGSCTTPFRRAPGAPDPWSAPNPTSRHQEPLRGLTRRRFGAIPEASAPAAPLVDPRRARRRIRAPGYRARRPRPGGRAQEVLALVHKHRGITLAEIAKRMKIQPNYLYRVFSHLEKDGSVTKR